MKVVRIQFIDFKREKAERDTGDVKNSIELAEILINCEKLTVVVLELVCEKRVQNC